MKSVATAASAVVAVIGLSASVAAQVGNPASPRVGTPNTSLSVGPRAPGRSAIPARRSNPSRTPRSARNRGPRMLPRS